jgi:hypothetical protein
MAVVSVAIAISFHLKNQPTSIEKRIAFPLGLIFWSLALACLASGFANYIKTVTKYSRRQALVQSGWKTQVVSIEWCWRQDPSPDESKVFTIVATAIVAACVLFLSTNPRQAQ